ncbi:response regulator [Luteimonas aquatica]|uniref:response regulator n=1 Tax=Luteimonas aquatica TaxID=450364 RepID=UPI001F56BC52|nr:response regulator [Luteimonas aquatica]
MTPHILLVEDDPVSRAFLAAAAEALPARVDAVDTLAAARERIRAGRYDLWLVDANLPDGPGASLLREPGRRDAPALAHTAACEQDTLARLREAGFLDVLVKPLTASALRAAIRRATARTEGGGARQEQAPLWDDARALTALNGQHAHVDALRGLFLEELPGARDAVAAAARAGDADAMRATLHRLRASCGFVGAMRMDAAVAALHAAPDSPEALAEFLAAAQDTLSSR